jgi:hypothetical protein
MQYEKIDVFFEEYEKAFNNLDLQAITKYYPESFISGGPKGVVAHNKKYFEEWAQKAVDFYRSIGQKSGRIISKKVIPISNEYCMVTVHWATTYEKTGDQLVEFDVSYVIQQLGDDIKVILFITHQDEQETMKKLGLQPESIAG